MISKKEHDAALRRVLRRLAIFMGGAFLMAAAFYLAMGNLQGAAGAGRGDHALRWLRPCGLRASNAAE